MKTGKTTALNLALKHNNTFDIKYFSGEFLIKGTQ